MRRRRRSFSVAPRIQPGVRSPTKTKEPATAGDTRPNSTCTKGADGDIRNVAISLLMLLRQIGNVRLMQRIMSCLLILLGLAVTGAAQSIQSDWKTIDVCRLSLSVPTSLENTNARGKDTCLGIFKSPTISLAVDIGWYSRPTDEREHPWHFTREEFEVGGKKAQLATYRLRAADPESEYVAEFYMLAPSGWRGDVDPRVSIKLRVQVKDEKDLETAKQMIRSLKLTYRK